MLRLHGALPGATGVRGQSTLSAEDKHHLGRHESQQDLCMVSRMERLLSSNKALILTIQRIREIQGNSDGNSPPDVPI